MWAITGMVYRSIERLQLEDVRGFIEISALQEERTFERREGQRLHLRGQKARVARQVKCCQTKVANLSAKGICLQNVPRKLFEDAEGTLKVVFRTRQRDYQMFVQPRWRNSAADGFVIGAEIIQVPSGWRKFIETLRQQAELQPAS